MNVDSRVALTASRDFTGTVERIDGDSVTVSFDVGGRGWLTRADLIEIEAPQPERTTCVITTGTKVARRDNLLATGTVIGVSTNRGGSQCANVRFDHLVDDLRIDVADLVEITDAELPAKAWPPPDLETKVAP